MSRWDSQLAGFTDAECERPVIDVQQVPNAIVVIQYLTVVYASREH